MNDPRPTLEHLESVLSNPEQGVVGFVDELLAASLQQDIRVGWQAGSCSVVFSKDDHSHRIEVPLRKPVIRAALARIAALCNERSPGSVSPYGGRGEIAIEANPLSVIRATFVNTPETQSLELASEELGSVPRDGGRPSAAIAVQFEPS
jgi:hypothetical protein